MKAIVIRQFGPPDVMRYEDLPDPQPRRGEIRIVGEASPTELEACRRLLPACRRRSTAAPS